MACSRCYRRPILSNFATLCAIVVFATGVVTVTLAAARVFGFFG